MANGGIPTGYAPVILGDLSRPMAAVTQAAIEARRKQYEKEYAETKTKQAQSRAAMMKAFDFGTIEGGGEAIKMKLNKDIQELSNDFTQRLVDQNQVLSDQDLMELTQRKRRIDQSFADANAENKKLAWIRDQLARPDHPWGKESEERYMEYVGNDRFGEPVDHILQKAFDPMEYFYDTLEPLHSKMSKDVVINPKTGGDWFFDDKYTSKQKIRSNETVLNEWIERLKGSNEMKNWVANHPNPEQAQQEIDEIETAARKMFTIQEPFLAREIDQKERETLTMGDIPEADKKIIDMYPNAEDLEEAKSWHTSNEFLTRIYMHDVDALNQAKTVIPKAADYRIKNNGDITFVDKDRKQVGPTLTPPSDWNNQGQINNAFNAAIDVLSMPQITGKQLSKNYQNNLRPVLTGGIENVGRNWGFKLLEEELQKANPDMKKMSDALMALEDVTEPRGIARQGKTYLWGAVGEKGPVFELPEKGGTKKINARTLAEKADFIDHLKDRYKFLEGERNVFREQLKGEVEPKSVNMTTGSIDDLKTKEDWESKYPTREEAVAAWKKNQDPTMTAEEAEKNEAAFGEYLKTIDAYQDTPDQTTVPEVTIEQEEETEPTLEMEEVGDDEIMDVPVRSNMNKTKSKEPRVNVRWMDKIDQALTVDKKPTGKVPSTELPPTDRGDYNTAKKEVAKAIEGGLSTPRSEQIRLDTHMDGVRGKKKPEWVTAKDIYDIGLKNKIPLPDLFAKLEIDTGYEITKDELNQLLEGKPMPIPPRMKVVIGAKGTIPYRHNNPGNLQFIGQKGATKGEPRQGVKNFYWAKFESPEEGFKALVRDIEAKQQGRTTTGLNKNSTVAKFVKIFADENEQKTKNYLSFLDKHFGIKSDDKIGDLDARYLAEAVARQESSSKILASK